MNKFTLIQFQMLLRREILEHRNLFLFVPMVLGLVILVINFLVMAQLDAEDKVSMIEALAGYFDGSSPTSMAPAFVFSTIPFMSILFLCAVLYLTNTLYQDRRDLSILFWQSMPVSNLRVVLSKIVAIGAIAPLFYLAIIFALYVVGILWLTVSGLQYDVEVTGLGYMFAAAALSLLIVYVYAVVCTLWLLPLVGWLLLFSSFAKRTPLLWAIGMFFMLLFLEGYIFGSQFLANWVGTRVDIDNYLMIDIPSIMDKLFSYDMFIGILIGSILITGSVYMRRFID